MNFSESQDWHGFPLIKSCLTLIRVCDASHHLGVSCAMLLPSITFVFGVFVGALHQVVVKRDFVSYRTRTTHCVANRETSTVLFNVFCMEKQSDIHQSSLGVCVCGTM